ncbi:hypothetical protein JMJ56_19350 [Belnapia sp. T18]|uniref:Uncharacterized protein n=1 Tax=Belnapia arida TaxID=2804533 RepID=A0ABS1U659_9PROT|nr:hypothetical protein [Belnapia arida]MBL6080177.1 hypothetical protein [Belnapia arida]
MDDHQQRSGPGQVRGTSCALPGFARMSGAEVRDLRFFVAPQRLLSLRRMLVAGLFQPLPIGRQDASNDNGG